MLTSITTSINLARTKSIASTTASEVNTYGKIITTNGGSSVARKHPQPQSPSSAALIHARRPSAVRSLFGRAVDTPEPSSFINSSLDSDIDMAECQCRACGSGHCECVTKNQKWENLCE
ncbi:hypothetical protein HK100_004217 [Physocladia obscura]|uniref:Uncharacterized protein n=1 Tax=Physocladia obscura TaxID=109957 RepID=A0AAD5TCC7_9FUNG|nr:hypothetical protein HK100_004217 [Physocladia obscura]